MNVVCMFCTEVQTLDALIPKTQENWLNKDDAHAYLKTLLLGYNESIQKIVKDVVVQGYHVYTCRFI